MTATERIELLKEVASVGVDSVPGCWGYVTPYFVNGELVSSDYVEFLQGEAMLRLNGCDTDDAKAIIAMLDAMEKEGFIAAVYPDFKVPQGEPLKYYVKLKRYSDGITVLATIHGGETRAEAVSRAFVAVFGGKG